MTSRCWAESCNTMLALLQSLLGLRTNVKTIITESKRSRLYFCYVQHQLWLITRRKRKPDIWWQITTPHHHAATNSSTPLLRGLMKPEFMRNGTVSNVARPSNHRGQAPGKRRSLLSPPPLSLLGCGLWFSHRFLAMCFESRGEHAHTSECAQDGGLSWSGPFPR